MDKIVVSSTVRAKDDEFPMAGSKGPTAEELKVIEVEMKTGADSSATPQQPSSAADSGASPQQQHPSAEVAPQTEAPRQETGGANAEDGDASMGGAASAAAPERQQEVEPPAPVKRGRGRPRKVVDPAQV